MLVQLGGKGTGQLESGVPVEADRVFFPTGVSSGQNHRHANARRAAGLEDPPVPCPETVFSESQATQLVRFEGVDAGEIDHNLRGWSAQPLEHAGEALVQESKVLVVAGPGRERHIQVAGRLLSRIIVPGVHGEGENLRSVPEDVRSSVPVVHVQINDRDTSDPALSEKPRRRHGHIVQQAESLAVVGKGVVKSSA